MKTIIQYITSLNDGGAEALVKDYAIRMCEDGNKVIIVVKFAVKHTATFRLLEERAIDIIPIYDQFGIFARLLNRIVPQLIPSLKLRKIVKKYNPDVIHVHLGLLHTLAPIRKCLRNVKVFYTCHNEADRFLGNLRPKEHLAALKLLQTNNLQIIALHDEMRKEINTLLNTDSTIVVRNGIDVRRFLNVPESKSEIRRSINVPEDAFVIGHVGRFDDVKNHAYLIRVFREVFKMNNNSFLLLIGSGPMERKIRQELGELNILDKTVILSHRRDMPRLLKAMNVFVFPSLFEGFSIALLEAQASGLRCLISTKVNKESFVTENAIAMDVSDSPSVWAKEIVNPVKKGKANRSIEEYDINHIVAELEKLYFA